MTDRFEKWWGGLVSLEGSKGIASLAWLESERDLVARLGGEWGEFDVGPTENAEQAVGHIRGAGRVILNLVFKLGDWSHWGNARLPNQSTFYNDAKLRDALDKLDPVLSDRDLVAQCNKLATAIAKAHGWDVPDGTKLHAAVHAEVSSAWRTAVLACEVLRGDDVVNALAAISDEDE